MKLLSVNVGRLSPLQVGKATRQTGIFKQATAAPVAVTDQGLTNDAIGDAKHHGGPDQAVYVYGGADYAWWSTELGADLEPGTFGENLTIGDLESSRFAVGDRLHIGEVVLEVTAPRIPCSTLAARMGNPAFAKRFRAAERPGLYCRVIRPGWVQAGDNVTAVPYGAETVSILEMFRDFYEPDLTPETLRRYLAAPIAIRDRLEKEERLAELNAARN